MLDFVEELLAESDAKLAPGSENSSESEAERRGCLGTSTARPRDASTTRPCQADGVPLGKLRQLQLVLRRGRRAHAQAVSSA